MILIKLSHSNAKRWLKILSGVALTTLLVPQVGHGYAMSSITPQGSSEAPNASNDQPPQEGVQQPQNVGSSSSNVNNNSYFENVEQHLPQANIQQPSQKKSLFAESKKAKLDQMFPGPQFKFETFCQLSQDNWTLLETVLNAQDEVTDHLRDKIKAQLENNGFNLTECTSKQKVSETISINGFDYVTDLLTFFGTLFGNELNEIKLCISCNLSYKYTPCHDLNDAVVIQIIQKFPNLKNIAFAYCPNVVTDAFFDELNQDGKYLNLEQLYLPYCPAGDADKKKTCRITHPECVTEFVKKHPNLKRFEMHTPNKAFTKEFANAFVEKSEQMETVYFGYWVKSSLTNIGEEDLKEFSKLKNLQQLACYGSTCISLETLEEIIKNCTKLESLSVTESALDEFSNISAIQKLLKENERTNLRIYGAHFGDKGEKVGWIWHDSVK